MQITINVKTIDEAIIKPKAEVTVVIDFLKRLGIPGRIAVELYQKHGPDYLVRKAMHAEYMKPRNRIAYFRADCRENYPESDGFHEWYKRRKTQILIDDRIPQELKRVVGRVL